LKSLFEASVQKAQNGPSTQLIETTSCVERWNTTIKAEELTQLSSYQMLRTDKNRRSYQLSKKLVKKWGLMSTHGCYSSVQVKRAELPFFIWIKGGANFEPMTPVHKIHVLMRRIF
jgi:hypothetical protein